MTQHPHFSKNSNKKKTQNMADDSATQDPNALLFSGLKKKKKKASASALESQAAETQEDSVVADSPSGPADVPTDMTALFGEKKKKKKKSAMASGVGMDGSVESSEGRPESPMVTSADNADEDGTALLRQGSVSSATDANDYSYQYV
jgi:hypothetical protein